MIEAKEEMDHDEEEEEEEEIDEDQIRDYCRYLDRLGTFPEKVAINSLSMAAEDFNESPTSASIIYKCIRDRLVDQTSPGISNPDRKLPLVYVLDSLLKNVKGVYIPIIQKDAEEWMPVVYEVLNETQKGKLKKVWNTWREFGVITDEEQWRRIGKCFLRGEEIKRKEMEEERARKQQQQLQQKQQEKKNEGNDGSCGFTRNSDGSLKLMPSLRKQMQLLLDEVQSTGVDELDKVSLERLADINPDLLQQIQQEAEHVLQEQKQSQRNALTSSSSLHNNTSSSSTGGANNPSGLSDWSKLKLDHLEKSNSLIANLQKHVRSASQQTTVLKTDVDKTVHLYAAVSASAQILTDILQQYKLAEKGNFGYGNAGSNEGEAGGNNLALRRKKRFSLVRREKFTTDGVKERNDAVVARLYEVGLPFVCSADGRRFGTQIELSKHLDMLFKKSQLERTMERTEERGWYTAETSWMGVSSAAATTGTGDQKLSDPLHPSSTENEITDLNLPSASNTVIADESRDHCVLCGINFEMFFDQEDGEWKYRNCTERNVWKDDVSVGGNNDEDDGDGMLVHVSCWEGLGSPEFLTEDQILHAG